MYTEADARTWQATSSKPVSQIWALIVLPSTLMLRVANSTPIVLLDSKLNSFRVKRESRFDFPTPESPMSTTAPQSTSKREQTVEAQQQRRNSIGTMQQKPRPGRIQVRPPCPSLSAARPNVPALAGERRGRAARPTFEQVIVLLVLGHRSVTSTESRQAAEAAWRLLPRFSPWEH